MATNPLENFISLTEDELYKWMEDCILLDLSGGYDKATAKARLEQEILLWVNENNHSIEVEKVVFDYLEHL